MPKLSIILPTYNGEKFIKESIQSILNQSFKNYELIIVNDCSTDNTKKIIENYAQIDSRIKIINNCANQKLPQSLNNGFDIASGEYYTWTSDDNIYKQGAFECMVDYLDNHNKVDLISCDFDIVKETGEFITNYITQLPQRTPLKLIEACNVGACFMYRKEIALKCGKYDTKFFCAEDYDYWCRIALCGNIDYSDKNLYIYRKNSQSLSATKQDIVQKLSNEIRLRYSLPLMDKYKSPQNDKFNFFIQKYFETRDKRWFQNAKRIYFFKAIFAICFYVIKKDNRRQINLLGIKITYHKK